MNKMHGFTLLDLMVALTIFDLLSGIAVPAYTAFVDDARNADAMSQVREIELAIDNFNARNFAFPGSLAELPGNVPTTDPWGNPYEYLRIDGSNEPGIRGKQRKDKNLTPLNSDYDLYSLGKDEVTTTALTARNAWDDIVRAGNGGFVGLAEEH